MLNITVCGKIDTPGFSHTFKDINFYTAKISVSRTSGTVDILPVIMAENLFKYHRDYYWDGETIGVRGYFRSRNEEGEEKPKLQVYIYVKEFFTPKPEDSCVNLVSGQVAICRPPLFRLTPFGREITDVLFASNRENSSRSDYIPSVAWGSNAKHISELPVGMEMDVKGRLQSRNYYKRLPDGSEEKRVAYELSISSYLLNRKDDNS
jgi:hypothetical protein